MYKPFQVLGRYLGISPVGSDEKIYKEFERSFSYEKPFNCADKDWSDIIKNSKPLEEKNFIWFFNPKEPFWQREEVWPPKKIEINLWLTSEYIEGISPKVSKKILKALREGRFSVKRTLNLRGLTVEEARVAFEDFIKKAILNGDSCVLIVHGRGLSSRKEPVLKTKVKEWLERGPFRKYVIAFCSARPCDGGLGATYVLLSSKPLKK